LSYGLPDFFERLSGIKENLRWEKYKIEAQSRRAELDKLLLDSGYKSSDVKIGYPSESGTEFLHKLESEKFLDPISNRKLYNRDLGDGLELLDYDTQGFNKGGVVYANKGAMIGGMSRGTDTVPAMLTPGEFVVNKKATQQNFALLKNINDGARVNGYSRGGPVYMENGGVAPRNTYGQTNNESVNISGEARRFLDTFTSKIDNFGKYIQDLSNIKLPNKIEISIVSQPIEVRITGSAALQSMEEGIKNMIANQVNQKMSQIWGQTGGEIGTNPATAQNK
jgi:hypothetical protein